MPRAPAPPASLLLAASLLALLAPAPMAAATHTEGYQLAPIALIFGGSLRHAETRVLLVPPQHGDLGSPLGPTVLDYLQATLAGLHKWEAALDAFAADHPAYAYLADISVEVEVFDVAVPVDPAGYDVVVGYVASGDQFRGVAGSVADLQRRVDQAGLGEQVHAPGRVILLSLLASSPRAHQEQPDFPEVNDLYSVTLHEFAHTFGLGHTATRLASGGGTFQGYDLMNSPAPFVYGDGATLGDGGERTPAACISSLDLYGMAVLYRWMPSGAWQGSSGSVGLPGSIPYALYC
jgi:hypothetical protein